MCHSQMDGQVEGMSRRIIEASVERHHYDTHFQPEVLAYDFISARRHTPYLEPLNELTRIEYIRKIRAYWKGRSFDADSIHHTLGLNHRLADAGGV